MLEEVDGDEVVVGIAATPRDPADGPRLASEVLSAYLPRGRERERLEGSQTASGVVEPLQRRLLDLTHALGAHT
jgi:hypothetical protein